MWGDLAAIALPFIFGGIGKYFRGRGVGALVKGGLLAEGSKLGSAGANSLMRILGRKGIDVAAVAKSGLKERWFQASARSGGWMGVSGRAAHGALGRGSVGRSLTTGAIDIATARANALVPLTEAASFARHGRAFGFAGKLTSGIIGAQFGFSLFSGADRFFEKNIPPPALELLQTQQEFLPRMAYTQRQRAIQAIHQSQMTTRAALGNEASYMHG